MVVEGEQAEAPALPELRISATKPRGSVAGLLGQMGVAVVPVLADEGDVDRYVLSKRLAVERRTGSSFLRGILEKTLFTSAIYLRENFRIAILIVEGEVNYEYSAFHPQAVRGALTSMMLEYGINVLCTKNDIDTAALLAMMARQEHGGIPEISLIPKRKATDLADLQRRVIEMLPGSGRVMARAMLQQFGSVQRIATATAEQLQTVPGCGAKKAAEMFKVLTAEYESVDTEKDLEDAIETEPGLLFDGDVMLMARQHYLFTAEKERRFVDMVFADPEANEVILVELKRGKLAHEHATQLAGYLDRAGESKLIRQMLDKGMTLRGVLATVEPCTLKPRRKEISVRIVDRDRTIAVLNRLRARRRREGGRKSKA